ncbi:hypothetical protein D9M68_757650 [compost metagenome]
MPVLDARGDPHRIARLDALKRTTPLLHQPGAGRDDQRLAQRVTVPSGARTRLEVHAGTTDPSRSGRLERGIDAHLAGEVLGGSANRGLATAAGYLELEA